MIDLVYILKNQFSIFKKNLLVNGKFLGSFLIADSALILFLFFEIGELNNYDIPCFASHLVLGSLKCILLLSCRTSGK